MSALLKSVATQSTKKAEHFTYSDYLTWDDDKRWELIYGVPRMMAAPTYNHQRILGSIFAEIFHYLKGKKCEVFLAPCDVRLNHDTEDDIVVQPDLLIVCDPSKLDDIKSCKGAPDMIAEILSPSTGKHDRITKLKLYKDAGVREYWIIDPVRRTVQVNFFENPDKPEIYYQDDTENIRVNILDDFEISMKSIFANVPKG